MARAAQSTIAFRIVIEQPVAGVSYSLQAKDGTPLDPKCSGGGEALVFDFPVRVGAGPKFFGDQVRPEGPVRRFVYVRVGELAGDRKSPWSRRIKIDIHDIAPDLLGRAAETGGVVELVVNGTGADGTPTCGTAKQVTHRLASR